MPKLKSGRDVAIGYESYVKQIKNPSPEKAHATPEYFLSNIKSWKDLLQLASILEADSSGVRQETGFLVRDIESREMNWSQDEVIEFKAWLRENEKLEPWLTDIFSNIHHDLTFEILLYQPVMKKPPAVKEEIKRNLYPERNEFISRFNISCFFHFTDERNLSLIQRSGGLLSLRGLRVRGIHPPALGGNEWSHEADERIGLDDYVHLCFMEWHPMEYFARTEGRIGNTRFLKIDPSVILSDGVFFTSDVSNKAGVKTLTFEEAMVEMDFSAIYRELDRRDGEVVERRKKASKYEILIPKAIPLSLINGV